MNIRFCDLDSMIVFATNSKGELVFIDDVENGYQCGCFCLHCHGKLNAKNNGTQKAHHFAHASGSDCKQGHENTLPLFVQRVLKRTKWILLPKGRIKFGDKYLNDYKPVSIVSTELFRIEGYPPLVLITTQNNRCVALYIVFTDDYLERKIIYEKDFDDLIEMDIRNYQGSFVEVEKELEILLTHRNNQMKWIKRHDEIDLETKIKALSMHKTFGLDTHYIEHFYCPKEQCSITSIERSCSGCPFLTKNILENSLDRGCLGFLNDLSPETIMVASKPDYSNIAGPSFLELNSVVEGNRRWLHLSDLPKAYPDIDFTLVFNKELERVFLVSLKAISRGQLKGLLVDPDGNVDYSLKSLLFASKERCWRLCSIREYKIEQADADYLIKHL